MACEHCESRKPIMNILDPDGQPVLIVDKDAEVMDLVSADGIISYVTFVCNYCPICGDDWAERRDAS